MKRLAFVGLGTALACVVLVVVIVAAVFAAAIVRGSNNEYSDVRCPTSAPAACVGQLARAWHVDTSTIPIVEVPAELHYDRGVVSKADPSKSVFFYFHLVNAGPMNQVYTNIILVVTPGWSLAGRRLAPHKIVKLANGHSSFDFTRIVGKNAARVGPIVERVGDFTVQSSAMILHPPWTPMRAAALDLLGSIRG